MWKATKWHITISKILQLVQSSIVGQDGQEMLEIVTSLTEEYETEMIKLSGLMLPELRQVLTRQRRDYGINVAFSHVFPAEQEKSFLTTSI